MTTGINTNSGLRHCQDDQHRSIRQFDFMDIDANVSSTRSLIRLNDPRPNIQRSRNEYVDVTKLPTRIHQRTKRQRSSTNNSRPISSANVALMQRTYRDASRTAPVDNLSSIRPSASSAPEGQRLTAHPGKAIRVTVASNERPGLLSSTYSVISDQPVSACRPLYHGSHQRPEEKGSAAMLLTTSSSSSTTIICKRCGLCRCSACARPRRFPSKWICGNHCLLSSQSVVETASCMCCVKALLYHVRGHVYEDGRSEEYYENGNTCDCDAGCSTVSTDQPTCDDHSLWSCSPNSADRYFRWTILGSAFALLPCLWCYLPLRICASALEAGYAKIHENGCRCEPEIVLKERTIGKRYRRSRTMPPELPSVKAAKEANSSTTSATSIYDLRHVNIGKERTGGIR